MKQSNGRIKRMMGIMFLLWTVVIANVLFVMFTQTHIWSGNYVRDKRIPSSVIPQAVQAKRGTFYDRNHHVIAQDIKSYTVIAYTPYNYGNTLDVEEDVNCVTNAHETAVQLSKVLDIDVDTVTYYIEEALERKSKQAELGHGTKRISEEKKKELEALDIKGIDFMVDTKRYYTVTPFASNLIGFAAYSEDSKSIEGKLGLEKQLDSKIRGENGKIQYQQSRAGNLIPGTVSIKKQEVDGYDVNLTLDWNLQSIVESTLANTMEENNAEKAWCIVMECQTGKVLAWSSYPTFNQNTTTQIPSYLNALSEESYELGSVMKPFAYATAIDTGVYPTNKTFRAHSYWYTVKNNKIERIAEYMPTIYEPINDALDVDFGNITFDQGLAYSSNVGICELLSNYVSYSDYYKYMNNFGFFKKVNMNYVKDVKGKTNLTEDFSAELATDYLSTGFGQSTSITPLQLMQAYTSIFNNGKMMKPYVVESITDPNTGEEIERYKPEVVGNPIRSETASKMCSLLKNVMVDRGTGARFSIDRIDMIGKTGTAEIYDPEIHGYRDDLYTSSIIAAAPSDHPKIMVYFGMQTANYNYSPEPFKDIFVSALHSNVVDAKIHTNKEKNEAKDVKKLLNMPSLVNHSLNYSLKKMEDYDRYIIIGDGERIIDQYPKAGSEVSNQEILFFLTDGNVFTMPNMYGWSAKEVMCFSKMTGITVQIHGFGSVRKQSLEAGNFLSKEEILDVYLE